MSAPRRRISMATLGADAAASMRIDGSMANAHRQGTPELVRKIRLELIAPSPWQRRMHFDEGELEALAESFGPDGSGLLQPPTVRPRPDGGFELVAGERRFLAFQRLGLTEIPAVVRPMSDLEARHATALENLAREDELPWEQAQSYFDLLQVARANGRANAGAGTIAQLGRRHKRSVINQYLRVAAALPEAVMREAGALTPEVLPTLTLARLDEIARMRTEEERVSLLRQHAEAVDSSLRSRTRSADSPSSIETSVARTGPRRLRRGCVERSFRDLMTSGGFQKTIRASIESLSRAEATKHLTDLAPVLAALATRAMDCDLPTRLVVADAPVCLWIVPTAANTPLCSESTIETR